jgi:hypothetical protein
LDYYSTLIQKGFWNLFLKILKDNKNTPIPPFIDPLTQQIETQGINKATILNDYFINISTIDDQNAGSETHRSIEKTEIHTKSRTSLENMAVRYGMVAHLLTLANWKKFSLRRLD